MKLHFASLIEILFPSTHDERVLRNVSKEQFQTVYHPHTHAGSVVLAHFSNPIVRACLHLCKFHNNEHAFHLASSLCLFHFEHTMRQDVILIPIPLSPQRERERGYNQSEQIALRACKGHTHIHVLQRILIRTRHTKPQTSLNKKERLTNMRGAFVVPKDKYAYIRDKHIIILDDVTTTGATLKAAKEAVRIAQPLSITTIAIAH